jgi:hypothetical protein
MHEVKNTNSVRIPLLSMDVLRDQRPRNDDLPAFGVPDPELVPPIDHRYKDDPSSIRRPGGNRRRLRPIESILRRDVPRIQFHDLKERRGVCVGEEEKARAIGGEGDGERRRGKEWGRRRHLQ